VADVGIRCAGEGAAAGARWRAKVALAAANSDSAPALRETRMMPECAESDMFPEPGFSRG